MVTEIVSPPVDSGTGPLAEDAAEPPRGRKPFNDELIRRSIDIAVIVFCGFFVFVQLGPSNLFSDTTPAGGDMGAHVWGPAYLRDHLLPNMQLTGWAPDWYDGFPAYQFYMVVPSLAIVLLNAGAHGVVAAVALLLLAGGAFTCARLLWTDHRWRALCLASGALALALIGLPYGVAFKLVSISGVVTLPAAAYAFGRLAGLKFPSPAALAIATLPFLFYRGFNIYGGNLASTLAGEFAFSMSLSFAVVYLGVVFRGLDTGRYRALAAVLLALTGLCHLIPAFWVLGATAIVVAVRYVRWQEGAWSIRDNLVWLSPVMAVGGLLSAFWIVPFALRRTYLNDMGWEKLPYPEQNGDRDWLKHLLPTTPNEYDLRWAFCLALVALGLCIALRVRAGIFLGVSTVCVLIAFIVIPEGRLWNGRLLPFYFLTVIMLAALAITETARLLLELARARRQQRTLVGSLTLSGVLAVALLYVGLPLGVIPFSETLAGGGYSWPNFSPGPRLESTPTSFVKSWANWNYSGYENKDAYPEYHDIVGTMADLGQERGCGRAFWEYQKELDRYGTPMALMLLPYWTDGCIGSMEGLYFEASATTPFHFLMQTELSTAPSQAQRDMPYGTFDIERGVQHMQLMGVRYYMATTPQAVQAADGHPDLTQVARSGPWVVYEVANSALVTPVSEEPAVLEGVGQNQQEWLEEPRDPDGKFYGPSVRWFLNPEEWDVLLAAGGPSEWQEVESGDRPERREITPAEVSNIDEQRERISFDVDEVGKPVLVKTSYFPNWQVDGAEGPWRVAPNLMVVVPTERHVELHYGESPVEWTAYALTAGGLLSLVVLIVLGRVRFSERPNRSGPGYGRWSAHSQGQNDSVDDE